MNVNRSAVHVLGLLTDELDVLGHLRPTLKILDGSSIGRHHLQHLSGWEQVDLLACLHERHRTVEPAGIEGLVEGCSHSVSPIRFSKERKYSFRIPKWMRPPRSRNEGRRSLF